MNSLTNNQDSIPRNDLLPSRINVARQCLWLTLGLLALWGVLSFPAYKIAGQRGLEGVTYAGLLCLIPGCLSLLLAGVFLNSGSPGSQGVLLSTGLRLMTVGLAAVFMLSARPDLRFWQFHVWLVLFYCASLALETCFILKGLQRTAE